MHLNPDKPFADGICFDDTWYLNLDTEGINLLSARGLVFLTRFRIPEESRPEGATNTRTGRVIASGWREAARIADARGLGEIVCHRLDELYEKPGGTA